MSATLGGVLQWILSLFWSAWDIMAKSGHYIYANSAPGIIGLLQWAWSWAVYLFAWFLVIAALDVTKFFLIGLLVGLIIGRLRGCFRHGDCTRKCKVCNPPAEYISEETLSHP